MSTGKIAGTSLDIEAVELEKLKAVFPQCFSEGKLDTEKLLSLVGEYAAKDREHYNFEWNGKNDCYRLAASASTATLRPCKDKSVNFDTTKNLYIEGDNLEVLKTLQKAYYGKVKMIYIDPPYNTGNDFVYEDDFKDPLAKYKELTAQATKSNPETAGRYHTNWLNMMFPRLRLAYNLLRDDGVIFISIDDNEVTNLRKLCDEVFGEENFVAQFIVVRSEGGGLAKHAVIGHDYLLVYAKSLSKFIPLGKPKDIRGSIVKIDGEDYWIETDWLRKEFGKYGTCPYEEIVQYLGEDKKREIDEGLKNKKYVLIDKGDFHIVGRYRKVSEDCSKFYTILKHLNKSGVQALKDLNLSEYFSFPKPISLCKELILGATFFDKKEAPIILDFFSGSATTAHAVMELNAEDGGNRRFIMVQLPELCDEKSEAFKAGYKNICDIGEERIRRAGKKILEQYKDKLAERKEPLDIGFKVFALDSSNLVSWDASALDKAQVAELYERMDALSNTIKKGRSDLDLVYEMMLKLCVPLDEPVRKTEVNGKAVWTVGADNELVLCLNENAQTITAEDIEILCKKFAPAKIVAAEAAFKDDSALSNAYFTLHNREIQIKLI